MEAFRRVVASNAWELIIVDNGSTDDTPQYLNHVAGLPWVQGRLWVVTEPRRGLSIARNAGWRNARAEIVAFTDDDCYVTPTYIESLIAAFREHDGIGVLGGRILLYDTLDYPITIQDHDQCVALPPRSFVEAGIVQGANMAFKKAVLEAIGGFDEMLGAGTAYPSEDIDAVAAVLWSGIHGVYDPRVCVYHHHGRKTRAEVESLCASYAAGRGAYYAKYVLNPQSRGVYGAIWLMKIASAMISFGKSLQYGPILTNLRELHSGLSYCKRRAVG